MKNHKWIELTKKELENFKLNYPILYSEYDKEFKCKKCYIRAYIDIVKSKNALVIYSTINNLNFELLENITCEEFLIKNLIE